MKYINIENGTWVEFNQVTKQSRTIQKHDLEQEIALLTEENIRLNKATDEELLEWARINYPGSQDFKTYHNNLFKIQTLEDTLSKLI